MIRGRTIICIASAWDYDPTSKHHLMRILSRENHVLWVNYHATRRPRLSRADLRGAWKALRRVGSGVSVVNERLAQVTPLVIPGARRPILRACHSALVRWQITRALRSWRPDATGPVQVWSFAPDAGFLQGAFGEECFVYYCVDDFTQFQCHDRAQVVAREREQLLSADLVVTTAERLHAVKSVIRPDAKLVPHGVDYDLFASAWQKPLPEPPDLAGMRRPIFGFFGLVHHWVDCALLARVAELRPQYSFVLIGDTVSDVSALRARPNVRLLGRRPHAELPAYCAAFQGGLLPFVRNALTDCVNPIKLKEYLAAGLPVVSTPIPEARRYHDAVLLADSAEEFVRACDAALTYSGPESRERISRLVRNESWDARTELLSDLVADAIAARENGSAMEIGSPRYVPASRRIAAESAGQERLVLTASLFHEPSCPEAPCELLAVPSSRSVGS